MDFLNESKKKIVGIWLVGNFDLMKTQFANEK